MSCIDGHEALMKDQELQRGRSVRPTKAEWLVFLLAVLIAAGIGLFVYVGIMGIF